MTLNKTNRNYEATGRAKVINYQLNSQTRKELCHLQGVKYSSIGNLFAEIEPLLLPRILALIGREHGHSEFYTSLIPIVPGLMSYIDRRALISRDIAAIEATLAELTKKRDELHNRRACMESVADTQGKDESDEQKAMNCGGKKRRI